MEILSFKNNISTNFGIFILTLFFFLFFLILLYNTVLVLPYIGRYLLLVHIELYTVSSPFHFLSSKVFCLFTHQTLSPQCTPFMGLEIGHIKMNTIGLCSNRALVSFGRGKYNNNNSKHRLLT